MTESEQQHEGWTKRPAKKRLESCALRRHSRLRIFGFRGAGTPRPPQKAKAKTFRSAGQQILAAIINQRVQLPAPHLLLRTSTALFLESKARSSHPPLERRPALFRLSDD